MEVSLDSNKQLTFELGLQTLLVLLGAALGAAAYIGWTVGKSSQCPQSSVSSLSSKSVTSKKKMPKVLYISRRGERAHCTDQCSTLPSKAVAFPACKICCKDYEFEEAGN